MRWKSFTFGIVAIFFIGIFFIYSVFLFVPLTKTGFIHSDTNSNFTLSAMGSGYNESMQFYPRMRFPFKNITYSIEDSCTLQKKTDMERAFNILEDKTVLDFEEAGILVDAEIKIFCDSSEKVEGGLFIAGEGGPSNVTQTDLFNVISGGRILLLRESKCATPNIAIHELLHVLGFDHSQNKNNVMYPVTNCEQIIGDDILDYINELYSVNSLPDLAFTNTEASLNGRYFNTKIEIINQGLTKSGEARVIILGDDKLIKEINVDELDYGYGRIITLNNVWTFDKFEEVKFVIDSPFNEIDKKNNEVILSINKSK